MSFILCLTGAIVKHFIGVTFVKQADHKTLTFAIKESFRKYSRSLKDLLRQGYAGATNMSGHYDGVQAKETVKLYTCTVMPIFLI